jgi:tetratricopeptide (TPR) repeat protein/DNA-binding MarR family transcriptional regulator
MGGHTYLPVEILDYIETHAPPVESPYGISQKELAKALGYHPCSVSRPLAVLAKDGLLEARRGLVRDGVRRQITYQLTERGRSRLKRETKEVPLLSGEIPPPPHPFLGRRDELEQLSAFSHEGGCVIFVDGPPGMGKTSLVSRHLRALKRGRIPIWFTVRPASSPRQFVTAISHALSFLGAQQLAYYSQLPRSPVPREVADLTARALGGKSLAAVIDDVQQAGPDMRLFLSEFVRYLAPSSAHQFLFVGQETPFFELEKVPTHRLTIGGLDRAAAHELTDRQGGLAERFEAVYTSSLGSPLLLKLAVLNPEIQTEASRLPTAVVRRLTIEEVRGILPAALANEPLPLAFLAEAPELASGRLNELTRTGVLYRTAQGRADVVQVVREALIQRVQPADEKSARLRLANYYGRSHRPEAIRERFLHLVLGEEWRTAAQLLMAQERVILRLGYSETLRNALRHLGSVLPRSYGKVRVLMIEAMLLRAHSDYGEALVSLRRAIEEAEGEPRLTAECHLLGVDLHVRLRQSDPALREFEAASRIGAVSRRLQSFFELSRGRLAEATGESRTAESHYKEAFELARKTRNIDLALESIAAWSRLAELNQDHEVALNLIGQALPEARQAGRMDIVLNLLLARARAYTRTGRLNLAESEMKLVRSEAESLGYLNQLTYTISGLTAMAIEGRRWAEAIGYARQATSMAERLGNDLVLGHTLGLHCAALTRQSIVENDPSLLPEAVQVGERGVEVLSRFPPSDSLSFGHSYLVEAYAASGNTENALRSYRAALDAARRAGLEWLAQEIVRELGPKVGDEPPSGSPDSGLPSIS